MAGHFAIHSIGHRDLPPDVSSATDADVETVLLRAAQHLGYDAADVSIARVASVVGGSCMACIDVVATVGGTTMLIATPALY